MSSSAAGGGCSVDRRARSSAREDAVDFDPTRPPSTPRDAAAVIVVRPRASDGRAELLLVRRTAKAAFMARTFVFPGGARDGEEDPRATAARELLEEAGVRVEAERLLPFSHWITPSAEKRRFSARFFVGAVPAGTEATIDGQEVVEACWVTPTDGLRRSHELHLPPPQLRTLWELQGAEAGGPAAVLALARERGPHVAPIVPRFAPLPDAPGGFALLLPWDAGYEGLGTGARHDWPAGHPLAGGPSRFHLVEERWRQS